MGIYTEPSQVQSFNFYSYNYYKNLSEIDSILYKHNQHYSDNKVDLHELRQAFFKSAFTGNVKIEWFVENDSNKHSFKLPYHVSDNPDRWLDNDPEILNILEKYGLLKLIKDSNTNNITSAIEKTSLNYYINSHGFRCPELDNDPCIAFLGCSHTFGTGLDQDNIWAERVCKKLGYRPVNLGFPARGIDFVSFYCKYFFKSEIKNCKALVVLLPPFTRKTIIGSMIEHNKNISDYKIFKHFLQLEWINELKQEELYNNKILRNWNNRTDEEPAQLSINKHFAQDLYNVENTLQRCSQAMSVINLLASELDIPLLVYSSYTDFGDAGFKNNPHGKKIFDMARDGQHSGIYSNKVFANKVAEDLKQKIDK
tara:strand:- start:33909 stop:35012 length:1104 start_codon:yes stop_codon:yes gene_type:complete